MKNSIEGFNQAEAVKFKKIVPYKDKTKEIKLDCTDLVILRWFTDFYPSMKKKNIEGKEYAWIRHSKLSSDIPLLDITSRACTERMQKLVEFEILDYQFVKENGNASYYTYGKNYIKLIESSYNNEAENDTLIRSNIQGVIRSNIQGLYVQTDKHNISINNNKINNIYIAQFEEFYKLYPKKKNKAKTKEWFTKHKVNEETFKLIIKSVEYNIKNSKQWQNEQYIPYPTTYLNNKSWEDLEDIEEKEKISLKEREEISQQDKESQEEMNRLGALFTY